MCHFALSQGKKKEKRAASALKLMPGVDTQINVLISRSMTRQTDGGIDNIQLTE